VLVWCHEQVGEFTGGVGAFEGAVWFYPAAADIHRRAAAAYRRLGQPEQAEDHERSADSLGAVSADTGE
jgi:hypothetical protein